MTHHFCTHRPLLMGTRWMITADHPLAAQAGAAVLEEGGNAVDAAVAANLVMTTVRPHMCGIGGDLFALIYIAGEGTFEALNASGRAPARATLDAYRDRGLETIPETGILTCTVPGAIAGWQAALERHGTMGLDRLLGRAIDYANGGFPVYQELVSVMQEKKPFMQKNKAAASTFYPGGRTPRVGQLVIQPKLAESYRKLAEGGPDAFYNGPMGEALVKFSQTGGGFFDMEDLANHGVTWEIPITTDYRGYTIASQPPNSQGIALLMQTNILECLDLNRYAIDSPELIHHMVETKKLSFADRDRYVCDPSFHPVPVEEMLSKTHAAQRAKLIDPDRAAETFPPRSFTDGGEDTIYLTVVDSEGNAVALIQSLYEAFGSCVMVPETGMLLHNRGRGFNLDPNHPNRLEPRKRPYHTLHPAMILKDGRPYMVLGTPGADGQTQTNIQLIVDMLDFGADPQEANEAPRWRSNPDGSLMIESRFPAKTLDALKGKGHQLQILDDWATIMGSSQAILVDPETGVLKAGADPRRQAYAIGK